MRDVSGADKGTSYVSRDASVALVSRDGLVVGRKTGMTTIAVTYRNQTIDVSVDPSIPANVIPRDLHPSPAAHAVYAERVDAALATVFAGLAHESRPLR